MKGRWATVFVVVGSAASGGCQPAATDEPTSGANPTGILDFDDSNAQRTNLADARGLNTAFRPAVVTCTPPSIAVTPTSAALTPAGVPTAFDFAITNHSAPGCPPVSASVMIQEGSFGLTFNRAPNIAHFTPPAAPGTTAHLIVNATPNIDIEADRSLGFHTQVDAPGTSQMFDHTVVVSASSPTVCRVNTARELMIKSTSVVDDPVRTTVTPGSTDPRNGVWTFKHLMENLAPTPADAPAMVEAMLSGMATTQVINGLTVNGRPQIESLLLPNWPRTDSGALDLARAPLRLQAIVNRFDLRDLANGDAGEGRFVFAFELFGSPLEATMILEYKLPASSEADVLGWAHAFHALGTMAFGESYNTALQAITQQFVVRGARPGHINGSAINTVRTNEIAFGSDNRWELREFRLSPTTGLLEPRPVDRTPHNDLNLTRALAIYINDNQAAIIAEQHTVPASFQGRLFQAGAVFNELTNVWFTNGVRDNLARHHFALNTCNGCHGSEGRVRFLQIIPRLGGNEANLSPFLTGSTGLDPISGELRHFNDLRRRSLDLRAIVCNDAAAASLSGTSLTKGIQRVH